MVKAGLARVYSFPDNRACVGDLLASEGEARGKGLGVWGSPVYRIESADDVDRLGRLTQTYQLAEGRVVSVGEGAGRVYLNFAISPSASRARMRARFRPRASTSKLSPAKGSACAAG